MLANSAPPIFGLMHLLFLSTAELEKVYAFLGKAFMYFFYILQLQRYGWTMNVLPFSLKVMCQTISFRQLWGRNVVIYTKDVLAKRWHCGCIDFAVDEQSGRR